MKRAASKLPACAVLLTVVSLCAHARVVAQEASGVPAHVSAGRIINSTYFSEYFGFTLAIPKAWSAYDAQGRRLILDKGYDELTARIPDKKAQDSLTDSVTNTVVLITVSKLPSDQTGPGNAVFACGAERLPAGPFEGRDYLAGMKRLMSKMTDPPKVESDIAAEMIDGAEFAVLTLTRNDFGTPIGQRYWSIVRKGYAVFCISTYANDEDKRLLNQTMNSFKFDRAN